MTELEDLQAKVDELTAQNRALEAELKLARGEVKTVLNNTEGAKLKAQREYEKYRAYIEQPRDEAWERELRAAKESSDYWHAKYKYALAVIASIRELAAMRKSYTLVEEDDGR